MFGVSSSSGGYIVDFMAFERPLTSSFSSRLKYDQYSHYILIFFIYKTLNLNGVRLPKPFDFHKNQTTSCFNPSAAVNPVKHHQSPLQ